MAPILEATNKTIQAIDSLFTNEQREVLEFNANNFNVTIQEQLKARFGLLFPMYTNITTTKVFAANIIRSQQHIINNIQQANKFLEIWKNPDSYSVNTQTIAEGENRNKAISIENIQNASESITSAKARQGEATRSFDYIGQEERWDIEDNLALSASNIQIHLKKTDTNDVTTAKIVQAYTEQQPTTEAIKQELERSTKLEDISGEQPYLNSITVNKTRSHNRNKKLQSRDNFSDSQNIRQGRNTTTQSIHSTNAINAWSLEVVDLLDRFFNSFSVLFSEYPTCR